MKNTSGFVVIAMVFVGLFALLAGWTARDVIVKHKQDTDTVQH